MTDEMMEIARRAVACKGWRWMPGMRWLTDEDAGRLDDYQPEYMGRPPDALPDLTDPATLGCLLARVREARGSDRIHLQYVHYFANAGRWECVERYNLYSGGATEAEALVAALEAAP